MGLESVTYISDLVATNPVGATDQKSQGDDHIRNIKSALLATFPNITGAVTLTHAQINDAAQLAANNTFTGLNTLSAANVRLSLVETDATANQGAWLLRVNGDTFYLSTATDAAPTTPVYSPIVAARSGTDISQLTLTAVTEIELNATTIDLNGAADISGSLIVGNVINGATGSQAAPEYSFSGDADTGMYRVGANSIGLSAGNSTVATFSQAEIDLTATVIDVNGQTNYNGTVLPPVEAKYKDGDETVNGSSTLQDDDDLAGFTLETGEYYEIEAVLYLTQASATPDIKLTLTFTNAPQIYAAACDAVHDGAALDASSASDDPATVIALDTSSGAYVLRFRAVVVANGTTGGTFDLQWAQNTSNASDTVLKQGSFMKVVKLSH